MQNHNRYCINVSRREGGLAIFVNGIHKAVIRSDLTVKEEYMESLFEEIQESGGNKSTVGTIYRRPKTDFRFFSDNLINILDTASSERKKVYITGDFNINLINQRGAPAIELTNIFAENTFY